MAFIEWDIPDHVGRGRKMMRNEVNLYKTKVYNTVTFNQYLTNLFLEKGLECISIREDDITGEIGFVISKDRGLKLSVTGDGKQKNFRLNNRTWVEKLHLKLGKQVGKRNILELTENLSKKEDVLFYKIINHGK